MRSVQNILESHPCGEGGGSEVVMGVEDDVAAGPRTPAALGGVVPGSEGGGGVLRCRGLCSLPLHEDERPRHIARRD
jgi:hypothetical protein